MSQIKDKLGPRVGNTIGERRQNDGNSLISSSSSPRNHTPQDIFSRAKKSEALAPFQQNPSASFAKGLRRLAGDAAPYKHPAHHMVEKGVPRHTGNSHPPTDNQILAFLDKVIEKPELQSRQAALKAAKKSALS